jgi:ATP-dependent Clp protease ATP-binding subunit ClpA
MGARPMARVIQEQLKKPLANEILFGRLLHGGDVRVDLIDNELSFDYLDSAVPA